MIENTKLKVLGYNVEQELSGLNGGALIGKCKEKDYIWYSAKIINKEMKATDVLDMLSEIEGYTVNRCAFNVYNINNSIAYADRRLIMKKFYVDSLCRVIECQFLYEDTQVWLAIGEDKALLYDKEAKKKYTISYKIDEKYRISNITKIDKLKYVIGNKYLDFERGQHIWLPRERFVYKDFIGVGVDVKKNGIWFCMVIDIRKGNRNLEVKSIRKEVRGCLEVETTSGEFLISKSGREVAKKYVKLKRGITISRT